MTLTLATVYDILQEHHLLKEFILPDGWHLAKKQLPTMTFGKISYDSRQADSDTLFFAKGATFKEDYLVKAKEQGLLAYVAEQPYEVALPCGIIVTDIRKAMALLSMAFYDYPQNQLKVLAFTGTKGKTTAAYFAHGILQQATGNKCAMLSTMQTTLDGEHFFKSHLTTPESLDLYKMMAEAVSHGMTHLVMEVSSQAYKLDRVYGLKYDVGVFLNISPDHISPIEHPTFDDYFYCKRELIYNSRVAIVDADMDYYQLVDESCHIAGIPLYTYGRNSGDYLVSSSATNPNEFYLEGRLDPLKMTGNYRVKLPGDFNQDNACAAILSSALLGATTEDAYLGLANITVPGRMLQLTLHNGATVYVDYAHNYISLKLFLEYTRKVHPEGRQIVVLGSPGNKAISRRQDFGQVLSELADVAVLTMDDPAFEDALTIAQEIARAINNPQVEILYEMDRAKAIALAFQLAQPNDVVLIAGKGEDPMQKINGKDTPYDGDYVIAKRLIEAEV